MSFFIFIGVIFHIYSCHFTFIAKQLYRLVRIVKLKMWVSELKFWPDYILIVIYCSPKCPHVSRFAAKVKIQRWPSAEIQNDKIFS